METADIGIPRVDLAGLLRKEKPVFMEPDVASAGEG